MRKLYATGLGVSRYLGARYSIGSTKYVEIGSDR